MNTIEMENQVAFLRNIVSLLCLVNLIYFIWFKYQSENRKSEHVYNHVQYKSIVYIMEEVKSYKLAKNDINIYETSENKKNIVIFLNSN